VQLECIDGVLLSSGPITNRVDLSYEFMPVVPRLWPIDKLMLGCIAGMGMALLVVIRRVPGGVWWLALHLVAALAIAYAVRRGDQPAIGVFRHWYPLLYVPFLYKETALVINGLRRTDLDWMIARLDREIWKTYPTIWLERIQSPGLTEILQLVYGLFIPSVILVAFVYWHKKQYAKFRYYTFLIALTFLISCFGYLLLPVRGPRFFLSHLQHASLEGLWSFQLVRHLLDILEGDHYDCFPSAHVAAILVAWWECRLISLWFFGLFSLFSTALIFSTVYLRYHYTVDLLAGAATAWGVIAVAPGLYAWLQGGRPGASSSSADQSVEASVVEVHS